ncbi:MAG: heme NO-binding domain-containing protein [Actinomycetota bacterium]
MYGLINRAIEELVRSSGGTDAWRAVCERAGVAIDHFESMAPYADDITYRLVDATSAELGLAPDDVLERFGRYWIVYTGAEGWGPIIDCQGGSVLEVLANLNDLHMRVRTSMPDLVMPTFFVREQSATRATIEYHSSRAGLAPMVLGLLRGLAERYEEAWEVRQVGGREIDGHDTFELVMQAAEPTPVPGDPETLVAP